jgi:hypothetical protein
LAKIGAVEEGLHRPPAGNNYYGASAQTDQKEDAVGRGPNQPTPKRGSAFEKLQSEREEKALEEDLERDEEEREERKREREKARGQEESS